MKWNFDYSVKDTCHANNFRIHSVIPEKSAEMLDNIVSQPTNQPINQSTSQLINQSSNKSINQQTNWERIPPTDRLTDRSTNQPNNQSTNWSTIKRAIIQQINPPINQLTNWSTLVETTQNQCDLRTFLQKKSSTWTFFCGNFTFVEVESHISLSSEHCVDVLVRFRHRNHRVRKHLVHLLLWDFKNFYSFYSYLSLWKCLFFVLTSL